MSWPLCSASGDVFESERAIAIVANQQPDALRKQQRGVLAPFGLRIIRAMQPSAARGKTAECVANQEPDALRKQQRGVLAPFGLRIIRAMQPSAARGKTADCVAKRSRRQPSSDDRSVAKGVVRRAQEEESKQSSRW